MTTYIGVGFKVNKDRSIFYIKEYNLDIFIDELKHKIQTKTPDFVSLRMAETEEEASG